MTLFSECLPGIRRWRHLKAISLNFYFILLMRKTETVPEQCKDTHWQITIATSASPNPIRFTMDPKVSPCVSAICARTTAEISPTNIWTPPIWSWKNLHWLLTLASGLRFLNNSPAAVNFTSDRDFLGIGRANPSAQIPFVVMLCPGTCNNLYNRSRNVTKWLKTALIPFHIFSKFKKKLKN